MSNKGENEKRFFEFLTRLRKTKNITLEKLCEGLCTFSMLGRIERGERLPDKLLRDRLLARLGVSADGYENFLNSREYKSYEKRQRILHCISKGNVEQAKELLSGCFTEKEMKNTLARQFYLSMKGQIMCYEGASDEQLEKIFEEAVKLTVPEIDVRRITSMILSIHEVNLIIEYERYKNAEDVLERYGELLVYVENSDMENNCKAKIYPKLIYYMCRRMMEEKQTFAADKEALQWNLRILKLCLKGIEVLRNDEKLYYMWELLELRGKIIENIQKLFEKQNSERSAKALDEVLAENTEWKVLLEDMYAQTGVPKEMENFCYLYLEQEVYCIGDVIRIRRKMLGLSREELSEGICAEKTLAKLEKKTTNPQMPIVEALLERLCLSGEYQRTMLNTDRQEANVLMERLVLLQDNLGDYEGTAQALEKLKTLISLDNPVNKQYVMRNEASLAFAMGKYEKREYFERLKEALECTLPLEAAFKGEVYLSNTELGCLYSMAKLLDDTDAEKENYMRLFLRIYGGYEKRGYLSSHIATYELLMAYTASYFGNIGDYDTSDEINKRIMRECLSCRRLNILHLNLRGLMWNMEQRRKKSKYASEENYSKEAYLQSCVVLSKLCKKTFYVNYYEKELRKETTSLCAQGKAHRPEA